VRHSRPATGFTMIEIMFATTILVVLGLPVIGLIMTGTQEAIVSEDYMEAEVLSSRFIEEMVAVEYSELARTLPIDRTVSVVVDPTAAAGSAVRLTEGKSDNASAYVSHITAREDAPGLMVFEVTVTWLQKRSKRSFALMRLRARENLSAGGRVK